MSKLIALLEPYKTSSARAKSPVGLLREQDCLSD